MQIVTHIGDESAGPSYSVPSLCGALQTLGCDVTLYTLLDVPEKDFNFEIKTFPISSFPTKALGRSPKMLEALSKDARNFDLIHSHMLWMAPNYYSGIVAKRYAIPYVCSPRGTLSEWALKRSVWKKKIVLALGQKKALSSVDCFHATAKQECREIKEAGYPNAHCAVIPNGIDIPDLFPKKTKPYKKVGIYELRGYKILVMNIFPVVYEKGRLYYYKNMNLEIKLKQKMWIKQKGSLS